MQSTSLSSEIIKRKYQVVIFCYWMWAIVSKTIETVEVKFATNTNCQKPKWEFFVNWTIQINADLKCIRKRKSTLHTFANLHWEPQYDTIPNVQRIFTCIQKSMRPHSARCVCIVLNETTFVLCSHIEYFRLCLFMIIYKFIHEFEWVLRWIFFVL